MTEEQLRAMSEQEIRARFRHAPAYYLQAKLEKKRALDGRRKQARTAPESSREAAPPEPSQWRASPPEPESLDLRFAPSERAKRTSLANEGLNLPLPGFEILDAALCESEGPLEDPDDSLAEPLDTDTGLTQQAILETALEDYSNWPFRSTPEPSSEPEPLPRPESELERKLTLVLETAPELELVPESEPELDFVLESDLDLEVVLESDPELERTLESETALRCDNVTKADFGQRAPRTVPVVSVVMDRKRPNMVRVVGKSTRLAG